jgi:hypothetical protein
MKCVSSGGGVPGDKVQRCEVDHSRLSSAEVKNEWSYVITLPACLHGVEREDFTFVWRF